MPQSVFGAGFLYGMAGGATPTPRLFGALQDVVVDMNFDVKLLHGQLQFPLEQARGKGKIDIKATIGRFDGDMFNELFFGQTLTVAETLFSASETVISVANSYTVANPGRFLVDLGVFNTSTKTFLKRVASGPATGQYSLVVSGGVYTFSNADNAQPMVVSYTYGSPTTGKTIAISNLLMGAQPTFGLTLVNSFTGPLGKKNLWFNFPAVICPKLGMPMKMDDFTILSLDMSVQDDGSGNIGTFSFTG